MSCNFYPRCFEDKFVDDDISLVSFAWSLDESESYCISSSVSVLASCDVDDFLFDVAIIIDYITYNRLILGNKYFLDVISNEEQKEKRVGKKKKKGDMYL